MEISEMMLHPNPDNALESNIGAEMRHEYELYLKKALEHAQNKANKPLDEIL